MAVYKVPQDVEADDKLLGPFSFKQFIFLIIAVGMVALAWGLFSVLPPLAIIPVPIALFFGALALPLRKDQPMEVYLAAVISFILKPKQRLWRADGIERMVEVIAPRIEEKQYSKGYDQAEVNRRLSYLATLVDTHGWSVRGVSNPNSSVGGSSMQADWYNEAQTAQDPLDPSSKTARAFETLIERADEKRHDDIVQQMQRAQTTPTTQTAQDDQAPSPQPSTFNPYPTMQQSIITPISEQTTATAHTDQAPPSTAPVSPAIMDLARNHSDLSVASLQREAGRIQKEHDKEVVISLH
ncbi:PrgI family protein [Candidatus Saccharibacteria bacterium oral taxon 488]|nr:PrgI family protein [Candidatus Saccharibacteria bacterium oral taxon 488]